jgi:pimeloyl-ACP methyl ester carboxylesterase
MKTLLLVHGAMHGAWCWDGLVEELQRRGVSALALELPGNGTDNTRATDVTLEHYAKHILSVARTLPSPPIVVGHSAGGIAISAAIELDPSAFARAVYITALLPSDGDTLLTLVSRSADVNTAAPLIYSEDGASFWMSDEVAAQYLYNGCAIADIELALPRLTPQPLRPLMEPITLTTARFGSIEKMYIKCSADRSIPPAFQDSMINSCQSIRVKELQSDHSPFISVPVQLADLLVAELSNASADSS